MIDDIDRGLAQLSASRTPPAWQGREELLLGRLARGELDRSEPVRAVGAAFGIVVALAIGLVSTAGIGRSEPAAATFAAFSSAMPLSPAGRLVRS